METRHLYFSAFILGVGLTTGFVSETPQSSEISWKAPVSADTLRNPFRNDSTVIREGRKIYESACWTCHGKTGKGDGPAAKGLATKPADHTSIKFHEQSDGSIFWKISKGKGQMAPYEKTYSKSQRWKLVTFIRSLEKKS